MTTYHSMIIYEDGIINEDDHSSLENALNEISNADDCTSKKLLHIMLWATK